MRIRPQEWLDRFWQEVGVSDSLRGASGEVWPLPVAIWQDGRGISSREAAPYATFAQTTGNPTATQHWVYTWTPRTPSKALIVRICFAHFQRETATALLGVQIGTAIAKAATNAVIEVGDRTGAAVTVNEITAANVPAVSVYNWTATTDPPDAIYPEYFLEAVIPPNQVLEIITRTPDDFLHLHCGYYTLPLS